MADAKPLPFLIMKHPDGCFRLALRATRYNSQGYPLAELELQEEVFKTATAAKAFARDNFGAAGRIHHQIARPAFLNEPVRTDLPPRGADISL